MTLTDIQTRALLWRAYNDSARKNKSLPKNVEFEMELERNMEDLARDLCNRTWSPSPMRCSIVHDPVQREVFSPAERDVIVSHLVFTMVNPLIDRVLIDDCYSCRKGRGTGMGLERFGHFYRSVTRNWTRKAYVLKLDISGYFISIDREILRDMFHSVLEKFRFLPAGDGRVWDEVIDYGLVFFVVDSVLDNDPCRDAVRVGWPERWRGLPANKSMFNAEKGKGVVIGDVLSQMFGNLYLNPLDHYVKRVLKEKAYGRYVDDPFIISTDRERLKRDLKLIAEFLKRYGLKLNMNKTRIIPTPNDVEFLGCVFKPFCTHVTNRTVRRFRARCGRLHALLLAGDRDGAFRYVRESVSGSMEYIRRFDSKRLAERTLASAGFLRKN